MFPGADFHEREVSDLVGIQYDDHRDLCRTLLPETWQGHPIGRDYNKDKPQIVTFAEHENPLADDHRGEGDTMFLSIGPHYPATHGVLHVKAMLDGKVVAASTLTSATFTASRTDG